MPKRRTRKSTRSKGEEKYKALNSFLMFVILCFVIFFIAQLPRSDRIEKEKKARVSVLKEAPAVIPIAPTVAPKPPVAAPIAPAAAPKAKVITTKTPEPVAKTIAPARPLAVTTKPPVAPLKAKGTGVASKFNFARKTPVVTPVKIPSELKGKISIVIDDWGYHLDSLDILDGKYYPITAAVLPNLDTTRDVARGLHKRGYEVILHLPMEPNEKLGLEKDTILTSSNDTEIRNIIGKDLSETPYVKGMSNHMGSRATSDLRTMTIIFKTLNKKRLYFLDSYVSPDSVCTDLADKMRVSFARRDVFLDNEPEPDYIRNQIRKLKLLAGAQGWAIGIGHDRKSTLEVLKEEMPKLEKEGYKFVYVSELVK